MSVHVRADKKDRKLREKDWKQKKLSPGSSKKTAIHRKHHRCRHYPRSPQLQCCAWKCRTLWTKMAVFFEGRHTHNSEYNIELGDGGNMTCMVLNFIGWLFFLKNPDSEKHRTAFTPLFASQLPVLFVRADIDWHYAFPGALKHIARTELIQKLLQI